MRKTIGITGGIGAGKSAATDYLRAKGYAIVDADEVAREAVRPGEPALAALATAFGSDILNDDGTLDRARLASLAFADADKTRLLNELLHDDIGRRIHEKLNDLRAAGEAQTADATHTEKSSAGAGSAGAEESAARTPQGPAPVFLSAPLLYEAGLDKICDEVWLITAPEETRITRAAARDGIATAEARARAARQMSEEEKRARADAVIENTESLADLHEALDQLLTNMP
jgi:dephospho-CoA kinase